MMTSGAPPWRLIIFRTSTALPDREAARGRGYSERMYWRESGAKLQTYS